MPVRLEGLFGGDPVYDYEHPRALAVGVCDLAFVLVWLLPLGVAAIVAFLTPEIERHLSAHEEARQQYASSTQSFQRILAWASPQLALQDALERLAGTSSERHRRFSKEVRRFQLDLRTFMYPRILQQAVSPAPPACRGCAARLNFVEFDQIPVFSFADEPVTDRTIAALGSASWLLALAIGALAYGMRIPLDWAL